MGMSAGSNVVIVVPADSIRRICPGKLEALEGCVGEIHEESWQDFVSNLDYEVDDEESLKANRLYDELRKAFEEATGLSLWIGYHESTEQNDDVRGVYFALDFDEVFQPTTAAKTLAEQIPDLLTLKHFITWG